MINLPTKIDISFEDTKQLQPKDFGIRKKLDIFIGTKNDNQTIIFHITQKSRFLQKDALKIEDIFHTIKEKIDENSLKKVILIESPLCSKAKAKLEELSWNVIV